MVALALLYGMKVDTVLFSLINDTQTEFINVRRPHTPMHTHAHTHTHHQFHTRPCTHTRARTHTHHQFLLSVP